MAELIHYLHLLAGIVWAGGTLFAAFVTAPTLRSMEPPAARLYLARTTPFAARLMGGSGALLLVTAIARTLIGMGGYGLADFTSYYFLWAAAAFVLVIAVTIHGEWSRARFAALIAEEPVPVAALRRLCRAQAIVTGAGISAIIAIMAILGLGLY